MVLDESRAIIDRRLGLHPAWSNFHPAPVRLDGLFYPSVEHAFQAAKTLDPALRETVRRSSTPGAAKRAGRRIPLRPDWEEVKYPVMLALLRQKFRIPGLGEELLASGHQEIVEDTTGWHDVVWGRCYCLRHGGAGSNLLGVALMQVRTELAAPGLLDEAGDD
jgi:ribA/ribD-fused uncharacterized protein